MRADRGAADDGLGPAPLLHLSESGGIAARYAPLGCPLHALVDRPALLDALDGAFAGWEGPAAASAAPLRIELQVSAGLRGTDAPHHDASERRLRLRGAGVAGLADAARGIASASLSPEFVADPAALRSLVIEPLALFLLSAADRAPIHAAGVVADGTVLLLAGPSGSGKSCLALAAQEAGLGLLSDDTVYLQTDPAPRAWGIPRPAHLYAEDSAGHTGAVTLRNGKRKRAVPLAAFVQPPTGPIALLLIERGTRVRLEPLAPAVAHAWFERLEPGYELRRDAITAAIARISAPGAWRMTLSADPREAIALLRARLPEIRAALLRSAA